MIVPGPFCSCNLQKLEVNYIERVKKKVKIGMRKMRIMEKKGIEQIRERGRKNKGETYKKKGRVKKMVLIIVKKLFATIRG